MKDIIIQLISIAGLVFNVSSFQQKNKHALILIQLFGAILFSVHFFLLGAYTGFLINLICILRATVFSFENMQEKTRKLWIVLLISAYLIAYVLAFAVFKIEFTPLNALIEALPTLGICLVTVSFGIGGIFRVRAFSSVNSLGWLTYNLVHHSVGGVLTEVICLISIAIGVIRHDLKNIKKAEPSKD